MNNYNQNPAAFDNAIQISTPISCDESGNLYFGYLSSGVALPGYPNGIASGLAMVSANGKGNFISAENLCGDANIVKCAYNCAPGITGDGTGLYIAVNQSNYSYGYLCRVAIPALTPASHVLLKDPRNSSWNALVPDDGTASPTVGPDGDVYFGILEANFPSNHARGWLLHFNASLSVSKIPGAFGWDDSASIVPRAAVPSYKGGSAYLVLTKYNNYADPGIGGNGLNKVALLDPNTSMVDPISGTTVMNEVLTVLGPTQNPDLPGVNEWCINSAAIDFINKCAVVNSEDGHVYRWSFVTNTLSTGLKLAEPTGEAYTSTVIGPDGAIYAINNAQLACCDANAAAQGSVGVPPGNSLSQFISPRLYGAGWIGVLAASLSTSGPGSGGVREPRIAASCRGGASACRVEGPRSPRRRHPDTYSCQRLRRLTGHGARALVGLSRVAARVDFTSSPRRRIASSGSSFEPIIPKIKWMARARSLCRPQSLGLRGGKAARSYRIGIVLQYQRVSVFSGRDSILLPDHHVQAGVVSPWPGEIEVSGHRLEIGFVGALEVGGAMTDRVLGLGDERLGSPKWRRETDERPQKGGPSHGHGERRDSAIVLAKPAAGAVVAQVQADRQHRPQCQGNGRHANSARGEQIYHGRQYGGAGAVAGTGSSRQRGAPGVRPRASSPPGSSSGRTGRPRTGSNGRATPRWPSRRDRRLRLARSIAEEGRPAIPRRRARRAAHRSVNAVPAGATPGVSIRVRILLRPQATAQDIPKTQGERARQGHERPQSGRGPYLEK